MSTDDIRSTVLRLLTDIAPEVDPAQIKLDVSFRDQLDIDSMDLLKFLVALHNEFGIAIPERDYAKLTTPNACVGYIEAARGEFGLKGWPRLPSAIRTTANVLP